MPDSALVHPRVLACPRCGIGLGAERLEDGSDTACPACRAQFRVRLFPSFHRELAGAAPVVERVAEGESSCFFHPENRATRTCDGCGRFVCSVCEIDVGRRRLCPQCLTLGMTNPKKADFVPWRFVWGDAAMLMGVLPFFFGAFMWPLLVATGPGAVLLAIWGWNKPGSVTRGQRHGAAIVGSIFGLLQLGILAIFILLITGKLLR